MLRGLPTVLVLGAILALGGLDVAWGQTPPAIEGLDKLTPEERAIAERNLERWQRLTPEERARALENYRQWRSMSPEEREARVRATDASASSPRSAGSDPQGLPALERAAQGAPAGAAEGL